jgi:hypothetical protein
LFRLIENLINNLLEKEWETKDRLIIDNLYSSMKTYKRLIPNSISGNMTNALEMCIRLKNELDLLRYQISMYNIKSSRSKTI